MNTVLVATGEIVPKDHTKTAELMTCIKEKFGEKVILNGGAVCLEEGVWTENRNGKIWFGFEEEAALVFEANLLLKQWKILQGASDLIESGRITYIYDWAAGGEEQDFALVFNKEIKSWDIAPRIGTYLTGYDTKLIMRALNEYQERHQMDRERVLAIKQNLEIDAHNAIAAVRI